MSTYFRHSPIYVLDHYDPIQFGDSRLSLTIEYHIPHTSYRSVLQFIEKFSHNSARTCSTHIKEFYGQTHFAVELDIFDLDQFSKNVKQLSWSTYALEFDQLLEKELTS